MECMLFGYYFQDINVCKAIYSGIIHTGQINVIKFFSDNEYNHLICSGGSNVL